MTDSRKNRIPESFTREQCLEVVIKDSRLLQAIPTKYIDAAFVDEAAQKGDMSVVSHLPKEYRNSSFYLELVELCPDIIWVIPRQALSARIGKCAIKQWGFQSTAEAVRNNPKLLNRLHVSLYDHDTVRAFLDSDFFANSQKKRTYGFNLPEDEKAGRLYLNEEFDDKYSLPAIMKWEDTVLPLLKMDGTYIQYADESIVTEGMCQAALDNTYLAFRVLPERFRDKHFAMIAFESSPWAIQDIPEGLIDELMVRKAIEKTGQLLKSIPKQFRTKDVCMCAVQNEYQAELKDVPTDVLDKDIVMAFFNNSTKNVHQWLVLKTLPRELIDADVCLAAVKYDHGNLRGVPEQHKTYEMCLMAIEKSPYELQWVPKEMMTEELLLLSLKETDKAFSYIPKELLNDKICLQAISVGYGRTIIGEIPEDMITQEMVDKVMERPNRSIIGVPEKFISEEMLIKIAKNSSGYLHENFPKKFRTRTFINQLINACKGQEIEWELNQYGIHPID